MKSLWVELVDSLLRDELYVAFAKRPLDVNGLSSSLPVIGTLWCDADRRGVARAHDVITLGDVCLSSLVPFF